MFFSRRRPEGQRVSRPRRSLSETIKLKLCLPFFNSNPCPPPVPYSMPPSPRRIEDIGRPRQLRRTRPQPFFDFHVQPHPLHRLPVEILALIFQAGAEDDVYFPITVTHVCRTWRYIALRTPPLWRRITLSPKERMWKERIKRARACSLDIELLPVKARSRRDAQHPGLDPYSIQWHMHMVLPYIKRWRSLEIVFPEFAPYLWKAALSRCCHRTGAEALLLEDLRLVFRANDDPQAFTLFSGTAPKLRSATLNGIRLNWLPSLYGGLRFLDYTHHGFTSGHQAVQDVIDMLKVSTQLRELRLTFPRRSLVCLPCRQEPVRTRVTLAELKVLHLRVEGRDIPFELARIATLLVTPSLHSLSLADLGRSYNSFAALKSFFYIYPLPLSLCHLRIEHGWYDPRMVTPIAQSNARIKQIVVKRPHMPEQVIHLKHLPRSRKSSHRGQPVPVSAVPSHPPSGTWAKGNLGGHSLRIHRLDVQYF